MDQGDLVAVQVVLQALHRKLVSWNDRGREHDRVAGRKRDALVLLGCDAHQGCKLLALRAGAQDNDLIRRIVADLC